jgi:3-isopropylmalate/(R)-2-methylmalate dehydratase large subunit
MLIDVHGELPAGVTAKDLALGIIGQIGTDATGRNRICRQLCAVSRWKADDALQYEYRSGARAGMIAPDATTIAYLKGRRFCHGTLEEAVAYCRPGN